MRKIIVTGCAGFIGSHVTERILREGYDVYGIDNLSGAYPQGLADMRLNRLYALEKLVGAGSFECHNISIGSKWVLGNVETYRELTDKNFDALLHFAATPGVRRSISEPQLYVENNIAGTVAILELARQLEIKKVLLASSSSVYGNGSAILDGDTGEVKDIRKCVEVSGCYPISPYAASKAAMELMGLTYHNLYGMDIIIPRYFTVYGEAGRPDMAYFKFMLNLAQGKPLTVYGDGKQVRDMTYIGDAVAATLSMLELTGYQVINVGGGSPVSLNDVISLICTNMGVIPEIRYTVAAQGDPFATCADTGKAKYLIGWKAMVGIEEGIKRTVEWFLENKEQLLGIFREEVGHADQDS